MMTEYYKEKLENGMEYQDYVSDRLRRDYGTYLGTYNSRIWQQNKGESAAGYEVKLDMKFRETHNLYIEVQEKSNESIPDFTPSGIMREDNSWAYLIGDYQEAFLFSKRQLRAICNGPEEYKSRNGIEKKETATSIGYVFPIDYVMKSPVLLRHFIFRDSLGGDVMPIQKGP